MFTAKGLFSSIPCPYQQNCLLPRCIFKHPKAEADGIETQAINQAHVGINSDENVRSKKRKIEEQNSGQGTTSCTQTKSSVTLRHEPMVPISSRLANTDENTNKPSAATRKVSPPPLKRKGRSGIDVLSGASGSKSGTTQKSVSKRTLESTARIEPLVKVEGLNPRVKIPSPASHDMRFKLLRALHEQLQRLNTEMANNANNFEGQLVLSEQALVTKALDLEEEAAASPAIYSNLVKNKILFYKRMSVKEWVGERSNEILESKALKTTSISTETTSRPLTPHNPVFTGLARDEELKLLRELYTPVTGLSKHGYVTSIPTEQEIEAAKNGIEAAKGWEVCDRCQTRFQVFPGRREEDGALTSGGKCTYHFGKPYWPERSTADPKAKREKKYKCCGESMGESLGCTQADCHVFKISEVKRLAAILNFERTPDNFSKANRQPVCVDGEMGYTVYGLELIRLTATSWPDQKELFDVLVRPIGPILDLNSRYSGVWPKDMAEALIQYPGCPSNTKKLYIVDSPAAARSLLFSQLSPDTPLIGHGLENDLNAVRIIHPTIIDTALLFPHKAGLPYRNGLKMLMQTHLNKHIQVIVDGKMEGHDSKEDANAAGELVRYALAEKWKSMKRGGWAIEKGQFQPPAQSKAASSAPTGPRVPLTAGPLDAGLLNTGLNEGSGRKRSREDMEDTKPTA